MVKKISQGNNFILKLVFMIFFRISAVLLLDLTKPVMNVSSFQVD